MGYKLHSTEEEKEMVQEYINGVPVKALMTKYGYKTKKSITDKVKKYESIDVIEVARKNRKNYQIEFNGITNVFNAYFLGLMLTDGYIQDDNKFGIDLTDEDCIAFISKVTNKEYFTSRFNFNRFSRIYSFKQVYRDCITVNCFKSIIFKNS